MFKILIFVLAACAFALGRPGIETDATEECDSECVLLREQERTLEARRIAFEEHRQFEEAMERRRESLRQMEEERVLAEQAKAFTITETPIVEPLVKSSVDVAVEQPAVVPQTPIISTPVVPPLSWSYKILLGRTLNGILTTIPIYAYGDFAPGQTTAQLIPVGGPSPVVRNLGEIGTSVPITATVPFGKSTITTSPVEGTPIETPIVDPISTKAITNFFMPSVAAVEPQVVPTQRIISPTEQAAEDVIKITSQNRFIIPGSVFTETSYGLY